MQRLNRPTIFRRRPQEQERPRLYRLYSEYTGKGGDPELKTPRKASDDTLELFKMGHRAYVWLPAERFNADGTLNPAVAPERFANA